MAEGISSQSAIEQFRDAIAGKGITPPTSIETDGKLHRFSSNGRPDDDAGWYVFHEGDIPAGSFGDFRTGQTVSSWRADIGRPLSSVEKHDFAKKQDEMRAKREADLAKRRTEAKEKTATILRLSEPASADHPYLVRKNVKPHGLRGWKGLLVVPMQDETGAVQSLQLISENGDKKFLSGGKMQGCYFTIGSLDKSDMILIAEGYATAATLHEATRQPVVVAYNAGNLMSVARTIRNQHPAAQIILCADDDFKTEGNPGLTKAHDAARAINGSVIVPEFGGNRPDDVTDFNDMAAHVGIEAVDDVFINHWLKSKSEQLRTSLKTETAPTETYLSRPQPPKGEPRVLHRSLVPNLYFPEDTYSAVTRIWACVQGRTTYHSETGYHILLDDKRRILVTQDRIELARKPRHRPDIAYVAACEHAREFWNCQMEVHGDTEHRAKAWAYAQACGIQITNFTPTDAEMIAAEEIMKDLRQTMEPTFRRPAPTQTKRQTAKPIV